MTALTGLPTADELAQAIDRLAKSTGHSLFGARLALAKGDLRTAHRCCLEHRRLIGNRAVPRVNGDTAGHFDGIAPAELLARIAALPPTDDAKRGRK